MDDANHCHRLIFLQEGRIVADGSPDELRAAVGSLGATLEDAFLHYVLKETQ
jgi:ABC-2 type transport system ATP-binding protein